MVLGTEAICLSYRANLSERSTSHVFGLLSVYFLHNVVKGYSERRKSIIQLYILDFIS